MSHGLPVISSNLPIACELLEKSEACLFFQNEDTAQLARCMEQITNETLWKQKSKEALSKVKEFSVDAILKDWERLLLN